MSRSVLFAGLWLMLTDPAGAHDIFLGTHDPETGHGCCNGDAQPSAAQDCARVPKALLDSGVITEVQGGYRVVLTIEQARLFNPYARAAIDQMVPWKRVQGGLDQGFALCIHADKVWCFFTASNS